MEKFTWIWIPMKIKNCETDMNFVMNERGQFVEIQGTAEKQSFTKEQMLAMMDTAHKASSFLIKKQQEIVEDFFPKS